MRAACSLSSTSCCFVLRYRNSLLSLLSCPCVVSMWITILSLRCIWARHQFVEQPHQPSAQLSGLFVGHVPGRARHHPFFRRFGWQPACGLPDGRELFSELFGEIVFAKTTERADVGVMQPHLHWSLPRRDFVECHGELLAHVSV